MSLRSKALIAAYKAFPFPLKGDLQLYDEIDEKVKISCVINFYGRINLLKGILFSLLEQDLPCSRYEVILVEDRGGTKEGWEVAQHFASVLNVRYFALPENHGLMGYSRNYGLSRTIGNYVLFLDDDTVILQQDFLSKLVGAFERSKADGIIPHGSASWYLIKGRYGYHEPYFPTSRCMAYRREALRELGGFVSDMIGQEDVEFVMRFMTAERTFSIAPELVYYHPPLLVPNYRKPMAVGHSFYRLRQRYPFVVWLLLILNSSRHMPLFFIPIRKFREMGRFGLGFFMGALISPFAHKGFRYS